MSEEERIVNRIVGQALSGRGAHVLVGNALDGFDWRLAGERVEAFPHTIFAIAQHLVYWQEFCLTWIDGEKPPTPEHAAESWPGGAAPATEPEWDEVVETFRSGLARLEDRARTLDLHAERGSKTVLEILQLLASHNSYHIGQIALMRRMLRSWPPPTGGATW